VLGGFLDEQEQGMSMRLRILETWICILGIGLLAAQAIAGEAPVLKTEKDKVSYGIGVGVARNFQRQEMEVDMELVIRGLRDALSGGKLLMSDKELQVTMNKYMHEMRAKAEQTRRVASVENKQAGDAFLAENKKKEGVVTLPSGLQYKVLKTGTGKQPTDADTVECRYRGTLLDGTEFDNSERSGEPTVTLELKALTPGVREALKLMTEGSQWQLFVPPGLAYGARGSGFEVGPNATLIFEIELIAVK
jgi:FKBP-type peptidyl-prolyl cis-trans isomerase